MRRNRHAERRGFVAAGGLLAALPLLAGLPLLGGCSGLLPGSGPAPALYRLSPKSTFPPDLPKVRWQLVLETPVADAGVNSARIALTRSPHQIEYYARANWTDRAPAMFQTMMIESFENSDRIVSVGRESLGLRADFVLKSELREFQAVYDGPGAPVVWVGLALKLVEMPRREIVAATDIKAQVRAEADTLDAVIRAFDRASGDVLKDLVIWVLDEGEAAYQRSDPTGVSLQG